MKGHIPEESIALLAGDDLDAKQKAQVNEHLVQCAACAAMLREYQQAREAVADLRADDLEASDYASVRQSVLERLEPARTRPVVPWFRWGAVAVAVVLLGIVLVPLWMRTRAPVEVAKLPAHSAASPVKSGSTSARVPPLHAEKQAGTAQEAAARPRAVRGRRRAIPAVQIAHESSAIPSLAMQSSAMDDVVVRLQTEDPNVIIIWLSSHKGERR